MISEISILEKSTSCAKHKVQPLGHRFIITYPPKEEYEF